MIYPLGKQPSFIAVGDFNGDHKLDMAVADSLESVVVTLLNTAVVSFSPTTPLTFPPQMVGTNSAPQTVHSHQYRTNGFVHSLHHHKGAISSF
jgi:hypothetical protein